VLLVAKVDIFNIIIVVLSAINPAKIVNQMIIVMTVYVDLFILKENVLINVKMAKL
jgi:hypothetical protein